MGRLSTTQLDAIKAGAPIRQTWEIGVPTSYLHSVFFYSVFHNGLNVGPNTHDENRVVRAGSRKFQVWNPSPMVEVKPKAARYSFTVRNDDGAFHQGTANTVFDFASGVYTPEPQECRIRHKVLVEALPGAYSELTHMTYVGQIIDVRYENLVLPGGAAGPAVAVITCEQVGAWDVLRRAWTTDDADDEKVEWDNGGTLEDYTWTVT